MTNSSKRTTKSITELLPYWDIHDGVMFLSDGRMEFGVEVKFPPALFLTEGGLEMVFRQMKSAIRNAIPEGQRLRLICEVCPIGPDPIDRYAHQNSTREPMAKLIGDMRTQHYADLAALPDEVLSWRTFITVTCGEKRLTGNPSLLLYALGSVIKGLRTKGNNSFTPSEFEIAHSKALAMRGRLVNFLSSAGLAPRAMSTDDVFGLCFRYFNPGLKHIAAPTYNRTWQIYPESVLEKHPHISPPTIRTQLAKSEIDNSRLDEITVGWKKIRALSLVNSPDETFYGMINHLMDAAGEFYLVIDLIHEVYDKAVSKLKASARKFYAATVDTSVYVDPNVKTGLREAESAIEHLTSSGDHIFQVGVSLLIIGSQKRDLDARLSRAFSASSAIPGSPFAILQNGLLEPYLQCSPFAGTLLDSRVDLLETNAAHNFPIGSPWAGSQRPVAMFHNQWKSLTFIDPFDPQMTNWNALIVGGSGQGKTFFAQYMITELMRQDDVDVIIIDRGRGYEKSIELLGGAMIDVEPGGDVSINPFDLEPGETEPSEEKLDFLARVVRTMIGDVERRAEAEEDAIISAALRATYARKLDSRVNATGQREVILETVLLRDFVRTLSNLERIGEKTTTTEDKKIADTLARTLQNWTGKSALGAFVDRPTNIGVADTRLICYDTSKFTVGSPLSSVGIILIAEMIWKRVKADPSRRKVVIFDECWALLEIPAAATFIVELYRRFRRYNAAAWSISQSLEDFKKPQAQGILQNTTYHYLLRIPGEEAIVKELLNLPNAAVEAFRNLRRVDGKYSEVLAWLRKEAGTEGDVLWVRPSPLDFWLFTTSARDIARRSDYIKKHNGDLLKALKALAYGDPR
jgi:conjugal transfer ATP-binding protein TraC